MTSNARDAILDAARRAAQAGGYGGLNFRDLAAEVGIKAASIHYYFPSKADLGAAVAKRYAERMAETLQSITDRESDARAALRAYPKLFREALTDENRMCLANQMAAETGDLPAAVLEQVNAFGAINERWIAAELTRAGIDGDVAARARAIFAAVGGAQLLARSRSDPAEFDRIIASYRAVGLLPE